MGDTDSYRAATDRVGNLIQELAVELAPRFNVDEDLDRDGNVPPNITLSEWVLVTQWTDLDSGRCFFEVDTQVPAITTHVIGLLIKALDYERAL